MLKRSILFLSILLMGFGFNSFGQIGAVIDNNRTHKKSFPKENKTIFSTKTLAFKITKNAATDTEKATAIYKWIAANISYDNELRRNVKLQKEFYISEENVIKKVLERKMALCGGFAFLFKNLCEDVGISAEVVHGYTKDYTGKAQKNKKPDHTWNVIKLNGKWQLLDITWAISHGSNVTPDDFWFLTRPSDFIYSHYPEDKKWLLLNNPISFSEF
ncbi:hypothetical protein AEQU3_00677 [Aequorivita antarctica]|uniref:Transglutaminase-like domain-containing protein n=2 Tax=Aequorivita antarctica TaxID=153266 RepID=A0A5C6Z200_9FLAO|nr:transglutaminase domain-containing protein [Aequorivita antarctica]TXD74036.1 hypothetical protein ESU54_06065 [Aequorivita antarctica]SRX73242.1 hypothetical protein AEQU3_00677 [Aequorivita antarctica]